MGEGTLIRRSILGAMNQRIWVNSRQPQTLYISQLLMYFNGVLAILFGGLSSVGRFDLFGSRALGSAVILLLTIGMVAGAFGIANERRWGYRLGVIAAMAPLLITLGVMMTSGVGRALRDPIGLMFEIALVALLLHPMSTSYQKIWFK